MKRLLKLTALTFLIFSLCQQGHSQLSPAQHESLVQTSRWLATQRIKYAKSWRPPGQKEKWVMDCSNTSRFIYEQVLGESIPRTASAQFLWLKEEGKVYAAPRLANGSINQDLLFDHLRSGDLLFWEWTYNVKRYPPISHVMVYLGKTKEGVHKMAGSASSAAGEITRKGGVDVYQFSPNSPSGGVWKNGKYHKGRFVAFGRVVRPSKTEPQVAQR